MQSFTTREEHAEQLFLFSTFHDDAAEAPQHAHVLGNHVNVHTQAEAAACEDIPLESEYFQSISS